jgi:uroporphyrin-III C-methyltransferase
MQLDLDPRGRKVVIFGTPSAARHAVRRFTCAGALVTLVSDQPRSRSSLLRLIGPAWLIVDLGLPAGLRERVRELAGHLRALMVAEEPAPAHGQVVLVGAGPGRASRLTLEACAALRQADVVVVDRHAMTEDLAELAAGAEVVEVGKASYGAELVLRARRGESVVRMSDRDPLVFGRSGEELLACVEAGVPVRVMPGVACATATTDDLVSRRLPEARAS